MRRLLLIAGLTLAVVGAGLPHLGGLSSPAVAAPRAVGAKNVILFVGDGMSVSTVTAARILEGQQAGRKGEGNELAFDTFPTVGLARTYLVDEQVADSAGAMTAMMSGVKTDRGIINVDRDVVRGDCNTVAGNELTTWLMEAETLGMSTGIVTTARLTHATPAAAYAVSAERDWEYDALIPPGCSQPDIARQLIEFPYGDGLEVALGGGRRSFFPTSVADPESPSKSGMRADGRSLPDEWAARDDAEYIWDQAGFDAVDLQSTNYLLGLFERSHMEFEVDRAGDAAGEPSLTEMTEMAINMLSRDQDGFVLVVEAGRIDHAHHATNAYRALTDTIELSNAVARARQMVDTSETLIVVATDHGHALTISGSQSRGNDILGLADLAVGSDGLPYPTLTYPMGTQQYLNGDGTRVDLSTVDTTDPDFIQPSLIPQSKAFHSGEDVPVYAIGPRHRKLGSVFGQGKVGRVIRTAIELYRGL